MQRSPAHQTRHQRDFPEPDGAEMMKSSFADHYCNHHSNEGLLANLFMAIFASSSGDAQSHFTDALVLERMCWSRDSFPAAENRDVPTSPRRPQRGAEPRESSSAPALPRPSDPQYGGFLRQPLRLDCTPLRAPSSLVKASLKGRVALRGISPSLRDG